MSHDSILPQVRDRLLAWYDENARDLPWREGKDPYRIWVSEIMLQQTRVEAVREPYQRFLSKFPSVSDLAGAVEEEVLACWSGLGYYGRARNLHLAAQQVVRDHGGSFPREERAARDLPGVGDYTAGAVLSIAYDQQLPAIDGNVQRVLARLFEIEGETSKGDAARTVRKIAQELAKGVRPGDWNQALMELGATLCLPRTAKCEPCPLSGGLCGAERNGRQGELPFPKSRPKMVKEDLVALAAIRGESVLLRRGEIVKGMWELPFVNRTGLDADATDPIRTSLQSSVGIDLDELTCCGTVQHTVLNRRLVVEVWMGKAGSGKPTSGSWHPRSTLENQGLSALTKKLLARLPNKGN